MPSAVSVAARSVKCVVWDLDNTVWSGVLLEDPAVTLRDEVPDVLRELDNRGILHSIASRNDPAPALERLRELGLRDYFLYPAIGWGSKAPAVRDIAARLNIGLDTIAFVDDDPAERSEVAMAVPVVRCFDAQQVRLLPSLPDFRPEVISPDARLRRHLYRADLDRQAAEAAFEGPQDAFLASLNMRLELAPAAEGDLERAEELTIRTNQLNSTGETYSRDELDALRRSDRHLVLVAGLEDRFGSYGRIGLVLVERDPAVWTIRLLLVSCRVLSRGVGTLLIGYLQRLARRAGARLRAVFVETGRNRLMYLTYKCAGFVEIRRDGSQALLEHDLVRLQPLPPFVHIDASPAVPLD